MDETIVEVEDYEEVVGDIDNGALQTYDRTNSAAPFKDPTQNYDNNSMASMVRPALRYTNLSSAEETQESHPMVVTLINSQVHTLSIG